MGQPPLFHRTYRRTIQHGFARPIMLVRCESTSRVSPNLMTSEEELDRFLDALGARGA